MVVAMNDSDNFAHPLDVAELKRRPLNSAHKRKEQLERWKDSETNRESDALKLRTVQFPEGCVFLAACSSGDTDEVGKLLANGADINNTNVDGLTALHQAVIDENLEMVIFLIENGADINAQDNEGWTAIHAAVSCGFIDIVRYLIKHSADLTLVNSESELPIDLAETPEIVQYLDEQINSRNIDLVAARRREEDQMMKDAEEWAKNRIGKTERKHPRSGATALHVASAKGYTRVMNVLLSTGANVNAQDNDGWTPLHAAVYWKQRNASELLCELMADMTIENNAGQSCFDVAEDDLQSFLQNLSDRQQERRNDQPTLDGSKRSAPLPYTIRKNSITRMRTSEKHQVTKSDEASEAVALKSASSSSEASDNEDELLEEIDEDNAKSETTATPTAAAVILLPTKKDESQVQTNGILGNIGRRSPISSVVPPGTTTASKVPKLDPLVNQLTVQPTSPQPPMHNTENIQEKVNSESPARVVTVTTPQPIHPQSAFTNPSDSSTLPIQPLDNSSTVPSSIRRNSADKSLEAQQQQNQDDQKTTKPPLPLVGPPAEGIGAPMQQTVPTWRLTGKVSGTTRPAGMLFSPPASPGVAGFQKSPNQATEPTKFNYDPSTSLDRHGSPSVSASQESLGQNRKLSTAADSDPSNTLVVTTNMTASAPSQSMTGNNASATLPTVAATGTSGGVRMPRAKPSPSNAFDSSGPSTQSVQFHHPVYSMTRPLLSPVYSSSGSFEERVNSPAQQQQSPVNTVNSESLGLVNDVTARLATSSTGTTPVAGAAPSFAAAFRSFQLPKRDDESEAVRKSHAKQKRESRRSTQGVTLDVIRAAVSVSSNTGTTQPTSTNSSSTNLRTKPESSVLSSQDTHRTSAPANATLNSNDQRRPDVVSNRASVPLTKASQQVGSQRNDSFDRKGGSDSLEYGKPKPPTFVPVTTTHDSTPVTTTTSSSVTQSGSGSDVRYPWRGNRAVGGTVGVGSTTTTNVTVASPITSETALLRSKDQQNNTVKAVSVPPSKDETVVQNDSNDRQLLSNANRRRSRLLRRGTGPVFGADVEEAVNDSNSRDVENANDNAGATLTNHKDNTSTMSQSVQANNTVTVNSKEVVEPNKVFLN